MNAPKKRGRPKGSADKTGEEILRIPPACKHCGSDNIIRRKGSEVTTLEISGVLPDGGDFVAIRWIPSVCQSCGAAIRIKEPVRKIT